MKECYKAVKTMNQVEVDAATHSSLCIRKTVMLNFAEFILIFSSHIAFRLKIQT